MQLLIPYFATFLQRAYAERCLSYSREKLTGGWGEGLNPPWEKGGPHWKRMKKARGSTFDPLWADGCR